MSQDLLCVSPIHMKTLDKLQHMSIDQDEYCIQCMVQAH